MHGFSYLVLKIPTITLIISDRNKFVRSPALYFGNKRIFTATITARNKYEVRENHYLAFVLYLIGDIGSDFSAFLNRILLLTHIGQPESNSLNKQ